ncbi:MAG: hypothetical protein K0Q95_822 [Bacteroidota bacterium]|nr:hypothetical protein [Bacteroidota bacterium]
MPKELNEISGISFVNEHTLACVQDEKGFIYLYDLNASEITGKIRFSEKGDYEGIAIADKTAWVITGEGTLYEVKNFLSDATVNTYQIELEPGEESEAICYNKTKNTLLLAFKDSRKNIQPAIYSFDLALKVLDRSSSINIDLSETQRKKKRGHKKAEWQPSDLAINKEHDMINVVDAININLIQLSFDGEIENFVSLNQKITDHPEGISISPDNEIYICNDGNKNGKGKIVKLSN